jgi:predicted small lipoprotein YifL
MGNQAETGICVNIIAQYFWVKIVMRSPYLRWLAGIFLCANLMACGTKGPLYIPEQRYPQAAERLPVPQNQVANPVKLTPKA